MADIKEINLIICGQVSTGRLEVLERFFSSKIDNLFIIGLSSVFALKDASRRTTYYKNQRVEEKKLKNFLIKVNSKLKGVQFVLSYGVYFITAFTSLLVFKRRGRDFIFLAVGFFPTLLGIIFKKLGVVKKVIYYSIDFFYAEKGTFISKYFFLVDKICVKHSDVIWSISPRIDEIRNRFNQTNIAKGKTISVPLCFDDSLICIRPVEQVDRWKIVFVGTSGYFHGLDLLVRALPDIAKVFPKIKIKIIGPGPWDNLKESTQRQGLLNYFEFTGFIDKEEDLFLAVSLCALGVAPYADIKGSPAYFADPGKPKLYAFCGLPVITTRLPYVANELENCYAGKVIDFNVESLVKAVRDILTDDSQWNEFRNNAINFAKKYTSSNVLGPAIEETFLTLANVQNN